MIRVRVRVKFRVRVRIKFRVSSFRVRVVLELGLRFIITK